MKKLTSKKMLSEDLRTTIEKATVTVKSDDLMGQGVLVKNNLILTVAHVVTLDTRDRMILQNDFSCDIKTAGGKNLKGSVLAVEPVSDIAVLGGTDDQALPEDLEAFNEFCINTAPVPVSMNEHELFKEFNVHILTHKGRWIAGIAKQTFPNLALLSIDVDEEIEKGTSGSAIVNDEGQLVALIAFHGSVGEQKFGVAPRPATALPVWVTREIFDANPEAF